LGIANTSVAGGGTGITGNTVNLSDTAALFLTSTSQDFTFHVDTGSGNTDVTVSVAGGGSGGLSGTQVTSSLNNQLQAYGITASIGSTGTLQFGGSTAFSVTTTAAGTGPISASGTAVNTANYNIDAAAPAVLTGSETFTVQNAGGSYNVSLDSTTGASQASALTAINSALSGSGIYAIKDAAGSGIELQSSSAFSINETQLATTGTGAFSALAHRP